MWLAQNLDWVVLIGFTSPLMLALLFERLSRPADDPSQSEVSSPASPVVPEDASLEIEEASSITQAEPLAEPEPEPEPEPELEPEPEP